MKMFAKVHKFDRITVITHTKMSFCWGAGAGGVGGGGAGGDCPGLIYISV